MQDLRSEIDYVRRTLQAEFEGSRLDAPKLVSLIEQLIQLRILERQAPSLLPYA